MSDEVRTVFKFGGAALADGPSVRRVISIVSEGLAQRPVVVVSAHSGVTDLLANLAESAVTGQTDCAQVRIRHRSLCAQLELDSELLNRFWIELSQVLSGIALRGNLSEQDRDAVLSIGERVSARIVAKSLRANGILATPVDAFDLGFVAESGGGQVWPRAESRLEVRSALANIPGVPVVTGFLARSESGLVTTLGPNGSDWTASWLAEAIGACELIFWKNVPGFMTADPNLVRTARVIRELSWEDALELTRAGSGILHPRAIEPARRSGVRVLIRDVRNPEQHGTILVEGRPSSEPVGLNASRESENSVRIAIVGGRSVLERAAAHLEFHAIAARIDTSESASLCVSGKDLIPAMEALHEALFGERSALQATDLEA